MRLAPSATWGQRVSHYVGTAAPSPAHGQEESRVCKRLCSARKLLPALGRKPDPTGPARSQSSPPAPHWGQRKAGCCSAAGCGRSQDVFLELEAGSAPA